ncbi:MAG: peptidoglycan DD-metalloendopeptidase family protein [Acidobacteriota bacterium]|nr:MAG: peptidoglycan DD-metalloendopeptidase family protein [Acidobacteriota bacterium]
MWFRRAFFLLLILLAGVTGWVGRSWVAESTSPSEPVVVEAVASSNLFGPRIPDRFRIDRFEDEFPHNSTLQDVLFEHDFTPQDIHQLITETRDVHNLNRVKAGHRFAIERFGDGRFRRLEYDIDEASYLVVNYVAGRYEAVVERRHFDTHVAEVSGRITDNLWNTLTSRGESGILVMSIYDVMQWDIDFTTIQPNDSFKLIFEKLSYEGEFVKYGDVIALQFNHGGKDFYAFQFEDPSTGNKKYYDQDGKGVKKAFLKVPFNYNPRVSSNFSHSRLHPVSKQRRPHLGIDYAAPTGTPVLASASGRITFAGWKGGNGKLVKIRHPNGYYTYYLHLSKILVKAGQSVAQGQQIGRVGSTGVATGPHLDYRIQDKRGKFINPRKYVALPSDTGVSKELMEEFIAVRDRLQRQLDLIPEATQPFDGTAVAG